MIGSPSGFTRTVGEGVKDFVALPYQGIFQGPWSFFSGLTNGSSSLVKHISAGKIYLLIVLVSGSLLFDASEIQLINVYSFLRNYNLDDKFC